MFLRSFDDRFAAIDGVDRRDAGDRAIKGRTEPVDVRPRSLVVTLGIILFEGRISGCDQIRQRGAALTERLAG